VNKSEFNKCIKCGMCVEECINWFKNDPNWSKMLAGMIKCYRENSMISLSYLELYAPSLELGSCWAGVFEICARSDNSPMYKIFNIPEKKKITEAVMVGYPKYSYKRFTDRQPLSASFYEN
jgi:nitroreductase